MEEERLAIIEQRLAKIEEHLRRLLGAMDEFLPTLRRWSVVARARKAR